MVSMSRVGKAGAAKAAGQGGRRVCPRVVSGGGLGHVMGGSCGVLPYGVNRRVDVHVGCGAKGVVGDRRRTSGKSMKVGVSVSRHHGNGEGSRRQ